MKRSVGQLNQEALAGKRVFLRADLNVPLDAQGRITDDSRIVASLPTIQYLKDHGAKVVLASHLGRPKGEVVSALRLTPVQERLSKLLGEGVLKADDCVGQAALDQSHAMKDGQVLLLENLRFHPEETANDATFSKALAAMGDYFVLDAFGTAHRAHASTQGISQFLPAYSGLLLQRELEMLSGALQAPKRPFVGIIGGAKVSSKLGVLKNFIGVADALIIGGGMMFTFLKAQGLSTGTSLVEDDQLEEAISFLDQAKQSGTALYFPEDVVVADRFENDSPSQLVSAGAIPSDKMGLDIGPKSIETFKQVIMDAKTILWNGPMGVFEMPSFAKGTNAIAESVAHSGAISIVGGGDSISAIKKSGMEDNITFISTGGGATLAFLEGKELPGLASIPETTDE